MNRRQYTTNIWKLLVIIYCIADLWNCLLKDATAAKSRERFKQKLGPSRASPLPRQKAGGTDAGKCQQSGCGCERSHDTHRRIHVYGGTDCSPEGKKQASGLSYIRTGRFVVLQNKTSQKRAFYIHLLWGSINAHSSELRKHSGVARAPARPPWQSLGRGSQKRTPVGTEHL